MGAVRMRVQTTDKNITINPHHSSPSINVLPSQVTIIYVARFTFTFMHLADAFIQSDLHCIQVTVSTFLSALAFPGNRTHDLSDSQYNVCNVLQYKAALQY